VGEGREKGEALVHLNMNWCFIGVKLLLGHLSSVVSKSPDWKLLHLVKSLPERIFRKLLKSFCRNTKHKQEGLVPPLLSFRHKNFEFEPLFNYYSDSTAWDIV
jgi:hypothetical protein